MTQSTPEVLSPHTITLGAEIAPVTLGETHSGQKGTYRVGVSIRGNEIPSLWRKKKAKWDNQMHQEFARDLGLPMGLPMSDWNICSVGFLFALRELLALTMSCSPQIGVSHRHIAVLLFSGSPTLCSSLLAHSGIFSVLCLISVTPCPLISVVSPLHIISSFLFFIFLCILSALHSYVFSPLKPSLSLLTQRHLELRDLCLSLPWRGLYLQRLTRHLSGI